MSAPCPSCRRDCPPTFSEIRQESVSPFRQKATANRSTTTISRAVARPKFRRFAGGEVGRRSSTAVIDYVSTFTGRGSDRNLVACPYGPPNGTRVGRRFRRPPASTTFRRFTVRRSDRSGSRRAAQEALTQAVYASLSLSGWRGVGEVAANAIGNLSRLRPLAGENDSAREDQPCSPTRVKKA